MILGCKYQSLLSTTDPFSTIGVATIGALGPGPNLFFFTFFLDLIIIVTWQWQLNDIKTLPSRWSTRIFINWRFSPTYPTLLLSQTSMVMHFTWTAGVGKPVGLGNRTPQAHWRPHWMFWMLSCIQTSLPSWLFCWRFQWALPLLKDLSAPL